MPIEKIDTTKPMRSISQFLQYLRCPKQFKYVYVDKRPRQTSGAMHLGSTCHKMVEYFHTEVLAGNVPECIDVLRIGEAYWEANVGNIMFQPREADPAVLKQTSLDLFEIYYPTLKTIKPKYTEEDMVIDSPDLPFLLRGIVDLVTADNELIDLKTSGKTPPKSKEVAGEYTLIKGHELQLYTYALILQESKGITITDASIHYLVKSKVPKVVPVSLKIEPKNIEEIKEFMICINEAIVAGVFPPNRVGFACGKASCAYWKDCVK